MFAQDEVCFGESDIFGAHDLVGGPFFQHAILVNARLMRKGIASDNRFVARWVHAGNAGCWYKQRKIAQRSPVQRT